MLHCLPASSISNIEEMQNQNSPSIRQKLLKKNKNDDMDKYVSYATTTKSTRLLDNYLFYFCFLSPTTVFYKKLILRRNSKRYHNSSQRIVRAQVLFQCLHRPESSRKTIVKNNKLHPDQVNYYYSTFTISFI